MKKGKKQEKAKTPVAVTLNPEVQPSAKMLKLQKKLGKIGKWALVNTTVVPPQDDNSSSQQQQHQPPPQFEDIPKISLMN